MQVRRATMSDMYEMQNCNLRCLPENYNLRYYYFHYLSWPQLLHVQTDYNGKTVGYVLAKIDDEDKPDLRHGHITSLAVLHTHRKLGIASRVMKASMNNMMAAHDANFCSLHVRMSNDPALHLYQDSLHFRCAGVEKGYYLDGEDAFHMKRYFKGRNPGTYVDQQKNLIHKPIPVAFDAGAGDDSNDVSSGGGKRPKESGNRKAKVSGVAPDPGSTDGKAVKNPTMKIDSIITTIEGTGGNRQQKNKEKGGKSHQGSGKKKK